MSGEFSSWLHLAAALDTTGAQSCWERKSGNLHKTCQDGSMKCSKMDFRASATNISTSRWHGTTNHHRLAKRHTKLQISQIFCLSPVRLGSRILISMKDKIYFHLKGGFWTTEQESSSFSPCAMSNPSDAGPCLNIRKVTVPAPLLKTSVCHMALDALTPAATVIPDACGPSL